MTSGTTGSTTITASSSALFQLDVDRFINFSNGYAKITAFTSATVVSATVEDDFDNTNAVTDWKLGAFSTTTGFLDAYHFLNNV